MVRVSELKPRLVYGVPRRRMMVYLDEGAISLVLQYRSTEGQGLRIGAWLS